jgi:hypothetical protein
LKEEEKEGVVEVVLEDIMNERKIPKLKKDCRSSSNTKKDKLKETHAKIVCKFVKIKGKQKLENSNTLTRGEDN